MCSCSSRNRHRRRCSHASDACHHSPVNRTMLASATPNVLGQKHSNHAHKRAPTAGNVTPCVRSSRARRRPRRSAGAHRLRTVIRSHSCPGSISLSCQAPTCAIAITPHANDSTCVRNKLDYHHCPHTHAPHPVTDTATDCTVGASATVPTASFSGSGVKGSLWALVGGWRST